MHIDRGNPARIGAVSGLLSVSASGRESPPQVACRSEVEDGVHRPERNRRVVGRFTGLDQQVPLLDGRTVPYVSLDNAARRRSRGLAHQRGHRWCRAVEPIVPLLARGLTVVTYDRRGFRAVRGRRAGPPRAWTNRRTMPSHCCACSISHQPWSWATAPARRSRAVSSALGRPERRDSRHRKEWLDERHCDRFPSVASLKQGSGSKNRCTIPKAGTATSCAR